MLRNRASAASAAAASADTQPIGQKSYTKVDEAFIMNVSDVYWMSCLAIKL